LRRGVDGADDASVGGQAVGETGTIHDAVLLVERRVVGAGRNKSSSSICSLKRRFDSGVVPAAAPSSLDHENVAARKPVSLLLWFISGSSSCAPSVKSSRSSVWHPSHKRHNSRQRKDTAYVVEKVVDTLEGHLAFDDHRDIRKEHP